MYENGQIFLGLDFVFESPHELQKVQEPLPEGI